MKKFKIISLDDYSSGSKKNHIHNKRVKYLDGNTVNIKKELNFISNKIDVLYYVDSITDKKALKKIFSLNKIDIIFHAAAYKHVNMMEANPRTSVLNNIYGTKLIIDFSI